MLVNTFNNMNLMNKALDGYSKRNETINNNISNVNTPGYKRIEVLFEKNLKNQINLKNSLNMNTTNSKHMKFMNIDKDNGISIVKDNSPSTSRRDGNNVNIDVEMANLAKNTMMYNSVVRQVSNESRKLRSIIKEGR